MMSQDQHIKVLFVNKNEYKDKFFENFENLYKECMNEWCKNLKIKMTIAQN